ncbi:4797_t:CDS:2 [Funneliformis geosporum]|uniref:3775_t:CDS:1 n=1 Tax=Funneliformis geosporum TaxID=1117311 RepID=A0A9W4ST23_9GLOM|nr:4797_t:CDS:2 [Funneliformis geosporum]CAI2180432.1 3775_t:CDS:2 [Funneliformis geosporum]
MSHLEYNKEPDFNAYHKNALNALQQIATEANILPKQKNLLIRPKKKLIIDSPSYFHFEHSSSPPPQDHPQLDTSIPSQSSQHSVIFNSIHSIKNIDWPNDDEGWIVIKGAIDNDKDIELKCKDEFDELHTYEILKKGGERTIDQFGKKSKENNQISNTMHHLEDDDVYLFL